MNYTPIEALKKIASMNPNSREAHVAREALATAGVQCMVTETDWAAIGRQHRAPTHTRPHRASPDVPGAATPAQRPRE
jgi:hypothetical protein